MKLKDGAYEVEDMFYPGAGFTVGVSGGAVEFFRGTGPAARLKASVEDPFSPLLRLPDPVPAPRGLTPERGGFAKCLLKSFLASTGGFAALADGMLKAFAGCSIFETSLFVTRLIAGGFAYVGSRGQGQLAWTVNAADPGGLQKALTEAVLRAPAYKAFQKGLREKTASGDPADKKLWGQMLAGAGLPEGWDWTREDAEECVEIVKANPGLNRYLLGGRRPRKPARGWTPGQGA